MRTCLLLLLLATFPARAATLTVTTLSDARSLDGVCSLREAIEAANTDARVFNAGGECIAGNSDDVITFGVQGTILLTSSLPTIEYNLEINGPGKNLLIIDGGGLRGLIHINPWIFLNLGDPPSQDAFAVRDLTLQDGFNTANGGGIRVEDPGGTSASNLRTSLTLTIEAVNILNCFVTGYGGALFVDETYQSWNQATVNIERSRFSGNTASRGGGIYIQQTNNYTIEKSLIDGNEADSGGGFYMTSAFGAYTAVLKLVTISGNSATDGDGGGIRAAGSNSTLVISHSLITDNEADENGGGFGYAETMAFISLFNTAIADNRDLDPADGTHPDMTITLGSGTSSSGMNTQGYNFIGINEGVDGDFPAGLPNADDDWVGTAAAPLDPDLRPLESNGGSHLTHRPREASPLIDAGSCPGEATDARGVGNGGQRTVDINVVGNADDGCDVGPFERQTAAPPLVGIYPISGSNAPFDSVKEAIGYLNDEGIRGEVTFLLPTAGIDFQATIEDFPRTPDAATSWVTFKRDYAGSGTPPRTTWVASDADVGKNWIVLLDGAHHVRLWDIAFETTDAAIGRIAVFQNEPHDLTFRNCAFTGPPNAPDSEASLIFRQGTANDVTVVNSDFTGGFRGVDFPARPNNSLNLVIKNNTFTDQTDAALYFSTLEDPTAEGNEISSIHPGFTGIFLDAPRPLGGIRVGRIVGNTINAQGTGGDENTGLEIEEASGLSGDPFVIANNMITVVGNGIYSKAEHNPQLLFAHNTIWASGVPLWLEAPGGATRLLNNILAATANKPALLVADPSLITEADFNALSSASGPLTDWEKNQYGDLAEHQNATGFELHSTDGGVTFANPIAGDLHLSGGSVGDANLTGTPLSEVTTDVDDEARSATAPYMGADEAATALPSSIQLTLTVLLEGPFDGGTGQMATALLDDGHLPTSQPFSDAAYDGTPLDYDGTETAASFPAGTVDWVLVDLRSSTSAASIVAQQAALLLEDGSVVGVDGASLSLDGVIGGNYHVVLRPRNHLAVLSAAAIDCTSGACSHDFTTALGQAYTDGGTAMADLGGGVFGLFSGDADADGLVSASDYQNHWRLQNGGAAGYLSGDFDLSGQVTAVDYQEHWRLNNGTAQSQVPDP